MLRYMVYIIHSVIYYIITMFNAKSKYVMKIRKTLNFRTYLPRHFLSEKRRMRKKYVL